jgi:hypothetical protein
VKRNFFGFRERYLNRTKWAQKKAEARIAEGKCPDCRKRDLHAGPQGGCSTNFACFSCLSRFSAAFVPWGIAFFERCGKITEEEKRFFRFTYLQDDGKYLGL